MAKAAKEEVQETQESQDTAEQVAQSAAEGTEATGSEIVITGLCAIKIGDKYLTKDTILSVSDDELKSQAWKHLFVTGRVQFRDDPARTREYVKAIKVKPVAQPVEPAEDK